MSFNLNWLIPNPQTLNDSEENFITFVHGFIVGPTPNPLLSVLLRMILFNKKDLPVRYLPATAIIPIFSLIPPKSSIASGLT